jgi:hypothetical protein
MPFRVTVVPHNSTLIRRRSNVEIGNCRIAGQYFPYKSIENRLIRCRTPQGGEKYTTMDYLLYYTNTLNYEIHYYSHNTTVY